MSKDINAITPEYMKHRLEEETEQYKQEIERLNKENKILRENAEHNDKVVDKVNWENKRLNNIINELEKWLKDYIKLFDKPDMLEEQTLEDLKEVLDKLQELKGSDKE